MNIVHLLICSVHYSDAGSALNDTKRVDKTTAYSRFCVNLMYIDFIRRCCDYKSGFTEYSESNSWLTCSIDGHFYYLYFYV